MLPWLRPCGLWLLQEDESDLYFDQGQHTTAFMDALVRAWTTPGLLADEESQDTVEDAFQLQMTNHRSAQH